MSVIIKNQNPWYPIQLDDNVIRSVASFTFFTAVILYFRTDLHFLILPLFTDFVLRWIHPKFSPLARLNKFINVELVKNRPQPVFSPPKRFAMLIGVVLTGMMSIAYFTGFSTLFQVLLIFLLIASGLQSWFDYCLGCEVFDLLIKLGIFGSNQQLSDFSEYLSRLNTQDGTIKDQLYSVAIRDGKISEEESIIIDQVVSNLQSYDELLVSAVSDGIISYEEKRKLWHDRHQIARKAYDLAMRDGKISPDEEELLSTLYDLLLQKSVID